MLQQRLVLGGEGRKANLMAAVVMIFMSSFLCKTYGEGCRSG